MRVRAARTALLTGVAAFASSGPLGAQDIETVARMRGLALPAAYYEQMRSDPTSYRFSRALFRRVALAEGGVAGRIRLPVVLALFSDSPESPPVTREMVEASVFTGPSPYGTLTDAYLEMSGGALEVEGDVFPWVRTSYTLAEVVGANDGLGNDGEIGAYYREALDSLDLDVDFAVYDNDGPDGIPNSGDDDGFVDVITIEQLEVGAHCGGPAIWAHRWTLSARLGSPYVTDDVGANGTPIRIDDYITQGASDCQGLGAQDASIMAHELGHALGLPDYYHWLDRSAGPFGRRWVLGCWSLMAAGSWGCGPVFSPPDYFGPTHLMALSKEELGWLEYREIGEVWYEEVFLEPVGTSAAALRVPLDEAGTEFLVAEYRTRTGFDEDLPAEGVLMYRHVPSASLPPNPSSDDPYRVLLIEQDANRGLLRTHAEGGNRGEAGDAWGVAGVAGALHAETSPSLALSTGEATAVTVHEVVADGERARIVISTSAVPRLVHGAGPFEAARVVEFLEELTIAGGVMPYTPAGDVPPGLSIRADGDRLVVTGTPPPGPTSLFFWVRDARGTASRPVTLSAESSPAWVSGLEELLSPLLEPWEPALSTSELEYLDAAGNDNGAYDVGDLRRWLRGGAG